VHEDLSPAAIINYSGQQLTPSNSATNYFPTNFADSFAQKRSHVQPFTTNSAKPSIWLHRTLKYTDGWQHFHERIGSILDAGKIYLSI